MSFQSILARASLSFGRKLLVKRTFGAGTLVFLPDRRFRATITGTEDFVTI